MTWNRYYPPFCFFAGPFANYLAVKTSFRKLAFAGGLLLGLGYAASCLVNRMEYLFITFGASAGT